MTDPNRPSDDAVKPAPTGEPVVSKPYIMPDDPEEGAQVQAYGQIVRAGGKAFVPSPGVACNGHLDPLQEGNPEG